MRHFVAAVAVVAPLSLAAAAPPRAHQSEDTNFDIQKVADGVYAAIRKEPAGLMFNANVVFIVNDDDVVVVDTTITPSSARGTLSALRKITPKPVKYVINTHWHDDHIMGNQTYREAFPDVQFVAHARTERQLSTTGAANRKQMLEFWPQMVQQLRMSVEQSKSMAGGPLTNEEKRSYLADVAGAERFFAEAPGAAIVMPTVLVNDKRVLTRGKRVIEVLHLGGGHTGEDLVVHLPQDRLVATGDLVVAPIPLIGSTSHPAEFATTLEQLIALRPAIIIPGHGPVMKTTDHVRLEARLLASLAEQVRASVAKGSTLADTRKAVNLSEYEKAFAGDSPLLKFIFGFYVTSPGVAAAYRDAIAGRGRGGD